MPKTVTAILPGTLLCLAVGVVAMLAKPLVPTISPLLWAIVLGVLVANLMQMPTVLQPGIAFSGKRILRAGIVLLGLQLVLGDILGLGWKAIVLVVCIVGLGIATGVLVGKAMGQPIKQTLLIATGFSICGAAAVAAADGVLDSDEEDVATAIGLVVLFGTLMIPIVPALAAGLHLAQRSAAIFAGGSTHEVAQVVAAASIIGGSSSSVLSLAVLMKMARVLMLAPVIALLAVWARRNLHVEGAKKPPLMPLFVFLFLVAVAIGSLKVVPADVATWIKTVQTWFLASAMFALGLGVRFAKLVKVGWKPFAVGAVTTFVVAGLALGGSLIA